MKVMGYPPFATDLNNPDFTMMAEAIGIKGILVERPEQVAPAIGEALAWDGPVLLNIHVNPSELSMPPKIEFGQVKGFGLYMGRQILEGKLEDVVQTIDSNFLH
jgi:thiamine pyrophosphate-dependent acetolactate synthase large subunit-like protein